MLPTMAPLPPAPLTLPDGRPLHDIPENHRDSSGLALPPVFSFAAVVGGASKTYWHDRFDEALRHSRENALAMRRDAYLMSLLQERKFAVSSLPWYLEVPDPKDKTQAKVRATLTQCLRGTRGLRRMLLAWLEAIWYGRYGVQFSWRWQQVEGRRALAVKDWAPVNGDKIGYHWDGTPYVLVNAARAGELTGAVMVNTTRARALSLQGGWRQRFIIHQHEIDDADYFEAEAAGGRHGVGIRSRIYWLDFLKREYLDWVVTYLERVGLGTTFWKYDAGNPKAKEAAEQAALDNSRRVNIVVPVWPDSRGGFSGGVERIEAPMGGVESLRTMIEAMDAYIERYVVGQAGSSRSQSSGLGNEAASEFMASTKDAIRDHDAHLLAETITGDESHPGLISLFQQYTFPEFAPGTPNGFPVLFKFGLEKSLNNQRVQSIQQIVQLGLPVRKDDIYNAAGLSRPEEQDDVLEPPQQGMGGPGGEGGGNPLAALMGGGGAPGEAPAEGGTPEEGGDVPASEDDIDAFLDELLGGGEEDDQPQQMARQGRGVEQYAWTRDTSYRGSAGGKWVSDSGDVRYQPNEPGKHEESGVDPASGEWKGISKQQIAEAKQGLKEGKKGWWSFLKGLLEKKKAKGYEAPEGAKPRDVQLASKGEQKRSGAKVEVAPYVYQPDAEAMAKKIFGESGSLKDFASAMGMPDDAVVQVNHVGQFKALFTGDKMDAVGVRVTVTHPQMRNVSRFIGIDADGKRFVRNERIELSAEAQGSGVMLDIFTSQVEACAAAGIDYLTCDAADGKDPETGKPMNGYFVWARYGYSCSLKNISPKAGPRERKAMEEAAYLFDAEDILDVMATPEGQKWWSDNGKMLYGMTFDLTPGSRNMRTLIAYMKYKASKPKKESKK